jgi:predicted MFS family arabinose efflux permease
VARRPVAPILLGGTFATGVFLVIVALTDQIPVLLAVAVGSGVAQSMVLVTYITLRTALSPDALLGRIGSTARTISLGLQPLGLLVGGALIDLTSGSTTIAVMGIVLVGLSLVFVPVRALRRASLQPRAPG